MTRDDITQDFIFGTLATDELRLKALQNEARGLTHGNRVVPADPRPDEPITLLVSVGSEVQAATVVAYYTLDGSLPTVESEALPFTRGEVVWDTLAWSYREEWRGVLPPQPAGSYVRYRIAARSSEGAVVWAEPDPLTGEPAVFGLAIDDEAVPEWVREGVIYHIFVDRFAPPSGEEWRDGQGLDGFWGGTLRGVIEHLDYVCALGATCIWLSPVFPAPTHHGYDATDYFSVEPRLGTNADLKELIDTAHSLGLRVLLDFVANHVSDQHPLFQQAISNANAPERELFTFERWPERYRSFFGVPTLPQLASDHPKSRAYLLKAATYWLEQGADGFRLDYANGPSHDFWAAFRQTTRAVRPDSFLVGEVVEAADLQRSYVGRFDGTLDFLLLQQLRAFFAFDQIGALEFDAFLQRHLAYFPAGFVLPSFLDNHDMNRFLWVARGDLRRLKLAALCQCTLPHPPVLYYGTEVGLSQWRDLEYPDGSRRLEESRMPMLWGDEQNAHLLAFYRALLALRQRYLAAIRGPRHTLACTGGFYVVGLGSEDERLIIAMNRSAEAQTVALPIPATLLLATDQATLDGATLTLPAMSGAALG